MPPALTTPALATHWGLSERATRATIGRLEALGFKLARDMFGGRRVPMALADAVVAVRASDAPLESLLADPELIDFRSGDSVDALTVLIEARAELAILRETSNLLAGALERADSRFRVAWTNNALPTPGGPE